MRKIKIALLHAPASKFLTGDHYSTYFYNFFYLAFPRCLDCEYEIISETQPTAQRLNKFDAVILFAIHGKLLKCKIPAGVKACLIGNAYDADYFNRLTLEYCRNLGIRHLFYHQSEYMFRLFCDDDGIEYKRIQMVLEPDLYRNLMPWHKRISLPIIMTGKQSARREACKELYEIRSQLIKTKNLQVIPMSPHFSGIKYPFLLQQFRVHTATGTISTLNKYIESMAAGCLTFAEANGRNDWQGIGLRDMENAVLFKTVEEFEEKAEAYRNDLENPVWECIASAGRKHVLENFNNDMQVKKLVAWIKEIIK